MAIALYYKNKSECTDVWTCDPKYDVVDRSGDAVTTSLPQL